MKQRRFQQKQAANAAAHQQLMTAGGWGGGGFISMGELPPGVDLDEVLAMLPAEVVAGLGLDTEPPLDLAAATPQQLLGELARRVTARVQERLMGGDPWAQDPVGLHLAGYRARWYKVRREWGCEGV